MRLFGKRQGHDARKAQGGSDSNNNELLASGARCCMSLGPAVDAHPPGEQWEQVCLEPATVCVAYNHRYHDEDDEHKPAHTSDDGDAESQERVRVTTLVIPLCATHGEAWRAEQETPGGELESYPLGYVEELLEQWRASVIDALATEAGMDTARIKRFCARVDAAMDGPAILQVSAREALARVGRQSAKHPPAPDKVRLA